MSNTPKEADDCQKLLDNGFTIVMFRGEMGSYCALALLPEEVGLYLHRMQDACEQADEAGRLTDDFLPSQALYRLTEKVTTGRIA